MIAEIVAAPILANGTSDDTGRLVRALWLVGMLRHGHELTFLRYRERWNRSIRSFRRDIALLRDAGFIVSASWHSTRGNPRYVFDGFTPEYGGPERVGS